MLHLQKLSKKVKNSLRKLKVYMFYFIWDFLQGYLPNLDIPKIDVWPMIERHITKHAREKIPLQKLSNLFFLTKCTVLAN